MTASDFAAILEAAQPTTHVNSRSDNAKDILAAKVPEMCQTCGGSGYDHSRPAGPGAIESAPCRDCPTIGQLLAIGAAVMQAEVSGGWIVQLPGQLATNTADLLLSQLRAVQP